MLLTDDLEMGEIEELSKASSLKRKRTASEDLHHAARPDSPSPTDLECPEQILKDPVPPMLELFSPRDVRHAMLLSTVDFCLQTSHEPLFVGNDKTFVQVAQTLADQVASGLRLSHWMHDPALAQSSAKLIGSDQHIEAIMTNLASNAGKTGRRCNLKEFATHGERNAVPGSLEQTNIQQSQKMQKPAYPTRPSTTAVQSTFKLQSAYARVQRTGTSIDISAPALRFWEELSLAPSHESKNVTALCIYPVNLDVLDHVMTFLNMIKGAYQSCNLGFFGQGTRLENDSKILPPVPTSGREDLLPQVSTVCARFGKRLGEQKLRDGNTVIYMVNFYGPQHLPTLCAGFLKLFDAYKVAVRQQQVETPNDLVLQIIPSDVICSSEVITMPSPSDYRSLAFEVYDHCGPDRSNEHKQNPQYLSTPAIRLAKTIPKAIDLRLTPDSSGPMLQTDNCLHVAYAWNISDHWLTASWTDNLGVLSWNACYYFGGQEEPPRQYFSDVAKEIWETTCDMMRLHSTPWRLFICKDSAVHREELDSKHLVLAWSYDWTDIKLAWQALLMNHTKPSIISTFLSIDTDPLLRFPLPRRHNSISELASNTFATPWTTLQPNDPPPDVGSTPTAASQVSTPPPNNAFVDSHDAEARLIDITDETWGIIMSNTLYPSPPSSFPSGAVCKPLATAYLMKRAGPRDEDGLVRLALGFLSVQMGHKMVIKEVLGMYAGLGLLARVRGVVDEVKGLMPLHVAAARKAHAVVNATMRYADG